jgi:hypothetical protein
MKFRKKPVVIGAVQFDASADPSDWPEGVYCRHDGDVVCHRINTLEGELEVSNGDWIITGVKGERYPCKPDIFEMTYEPLAESPVGG